MEKQLSVNCTVQYISFLKLNTVYYALTIQYYTYVFPLIPFAGPFCGTTLPAAIQTRGNRLLMRFHADFFTESKGFRAYWSTDPDQTAPTEPPIPPNPWDDIPIDKPSVAF